MILVNPQLPTSPPSRECDSARYGEASPKLGANAGRVRQAAAGNSQSTLSRSALDVWKLGVGSWELTRFLSLDSRRYLRLEGGTIPLMRKYVTRLP